MGTGQSAQEIKYKVVAKRDSDMIKAFLTFLNRVKNPRVTTNFIVFGLVIFFLPFTTTGQPILSVCCYIIGAFMVLMGFFRHYIPLSMMKKKDPDYISGTIYTYIFGNRDVQVFKGDELYLLAGSYQKITSFFNDEYYYYVGMNNDDLFVLPRNCFTVGDAAEFENYICDRSQMECRWIPVKIKNKLLMSFTRVKENIQYLKEQGSKKPKQNSKK